MKIPFYVMTVVLIWAGGANGQGKTTLVQTSNGALEGVIEVSGIRSFKGVPFAQPPVGERRFREPQPVQNWKGIRKADHFGPRAMQLPIYSDMQFRSDGVSEDCLYLNVGTSAKTSGEQLPVLVYFYGGGFTAGDGSEYRYDGENLATKGIVTVTVNYRLGVFGFLAHPDLTKESEHHASGNYGLLDQHAALVWVQRNIAAFGGDPKRVTIGGESAGSTSVCAQMASPLNKGLFIRAIGESGVLLGTSKPVSLADAEKAGLSFADSLGNKSLADLRSLSATDLLNAASKTRFRIAIDGYFLPGSPAAIFAAGTQVPASLLAGWNSAEGNYSGILGKEEPTVDNFGKAVHGIYADKADSVLDLYKAASVEEVKQAATDLATDRSIGYNTWKWLDLHRKTGGKPVYRYFYTHPRPPAVGSPAGAQQPAGAGHSWEIEYALGNLTSNTVFAWTPDDYKVSEIMEAYFANFIKTGDPNGRGLPSWPALQPGGAGVMVIDVVAHPLALQSDARYRLLDSTVK